MREKTFVNLSICKCNIKSKPNTFYARVCNTGRVSSEELLSCLKKEAPYLDIDMLRAGMEKMANLIANMAASGKTVDFFNLGTFSLASEGAVEVKSGMQNYLSDEACECENADFDISEAIIKEPKFKLKFEPSTSCKKAYSNVKMALALKKRRAPVIEKVENVFSENDEEATFSIIRVKGENLKIAGEKDEVGVYIKEENGEKIKIAKSNIIENTPKMLVILLSNKLKKQRSYTLSLLTQYVAMGNTSTTSILRSGKVEFLWKEGEKMSECRERRGRLKRRSKEREVKSIKKMPSLLSLAA